MIELTSDSTKLLDVIRDWFRLLAAYQWIEATTMLDEPNCYGIVWTPEYIRYAINLAYCPGCRFRVAHPEGPQFSNPDTAIGESQFEVMELDDNKGYHVDYNVPLNGVWSELTAQLQFLRKNDGLVMILHDLHIL